MEIINNWGWNYAASRERAGVGGGNTGQRDRKHKVLGRKMLIEGEKKIN